MSQPGTVIVLQNGTAVNVDSIQSQQPNVILVQQPQQQQTAAPADDLGRFGRNLNRKITKISGDLLIVCGFFAIIGGLLETIAFAIKIAQIEGDLGLNIAYNDYSVSQYSGYWCGALIMASGAVATHSAKHISNCMVITDVVAAGNAIVFAIILLALTAKEMSTVIDFNDACAVLARCTTFSAMMLASYSIMIGTSSLALIFGAVLAVFTVIALLKGLCGGGNNVGIA